ncbi:hypothetical protein PtrM4_114060 [Pyrenophora tritici-repentis]|uniref:Secreted protein n=1 Tax=Pyrenophora tritici-repentis TaxID=45151 RepID=A0A834RRI2_9PLEO|nr:hypothetical protein PtrM4_114060 [Pyrenophora tritici-repentis]
MRITIVSIVFPALLVSGQDVCCGGKGTGGYVNAPPNWCEQQNPNAHMYCVSIAMSLLLYPSNRA